MAQKTLAILVCAAALYTSACGDALGTGTYDVRIYGESFIEDHIPASETDGWRIEFEQFLVAVSDISATGESERYDLPGSYVFELTDNSVGLGQAIGSLEAREGRIDALTFRVGPITDTVGGNVESEDVELMTSGGYSMVVSGVATRASASGGEDDVVTFTWMFDTDTTYRDCHTTAVIPDEGVGTSVLTIHADHLFYDDLESAEPNVAFDLIASADDGDGDVTAEELEAFDITGQSRYQVGSRDITDLWTFIETQTQTVGHIDGEGHCDVH